MTHPQPVTGPMCWDRASAGQPKQFALALDAPDVREVNPKPPGTATVVRRAVLGGLRNEYEWAV